MKPRHGATLRTAPATTCGNVHPAPLRWPRRLRRLPSGGRATRVSSETPRPACGVSWWLTARTRRDGESGGSAMWKKQSAISGQGGTVGGKGGPVTPDEVLRYAEEAAYVAESLRSWAASFAADATTRQRCRATDVLLAIIQRHGAASQKFAQRMTRESLLDGARLE